MGRALKSKVSLSHVDTLKQIIANSEECQKLPKVTKQKE